MNRLGQLFAASIAISWCRLAFLPEQLAGIAFLRPFRVTGAMIILMAGAVSFAAPNVVSASLLVVAVARGRVVEIVRP